MRGWGRVGKRFRGVRCGFEQLELRKIRGTGLAAAAQARRAARSAWGKRGAGEEGKPATHRAGAGGRAGGRGGDGGHLDHAPAGDALRAGHCDGFGFLGGGGGRERRRGDCGVSDERARGDGGGATIFFFSLSLSSCDAAQAREQSVRRVARLMLSPGSTPAQARDLGRVARRKPRAALGLSLSLSRIARRKQGAAAPHDQYWQLRASKTHPCTRGSHASRA